MDPLLNVILRHQIYAEGLKAGKQAEYLRVMAQLNLALRRELANVEYDDLGELSKRQLDKLLASLKRAAKSIFDAYLNDMIKWLEAFMHADFEFWQFAFGMYAADGGDEMIEEVEEEETWNAIGAMPMGATGYAWRIFLAASGILATNKIVAMVTQHWADKAKKQELLNALLGTEAAKLNDGLLAKLVRDGNAASNTVIQHITANTNSAVAAQWWPEYRWISVLDNATTEICRNRNGLKWRYGAGPIPPAHIGCRSSIAPVTSRSVLDDMPTFKLWAAAQSEAFKEDAFDGKVPSRYEGSKPISLAEFVEKRQLIVA
jgi:SPP1 gp7 family putative phage head morphogenesis protein